MTVRHVLSHTAGVPGIQLDTTPEDLCDWDKMCAAIARAKLWTKNRLTPEFTTATEITQIVTRATAGG